MRLLGKSVGKFCREIPGYLPHCHGLLIEIDHYGERLVGCVECNRWSWRRGSYANDGRSRFLVRNSLMRSCEAISESCSSMPVPMLWLLVPPNNRHRKFDRQP